MKIFEELKSFYDRFALEIESRLNRLRQYAIGDKVIYAARTPVEVKREFPPDAKYPRWVYVLALLLLIVGFFLSIWMLGAIGNAST